MIHRSQLYGPVFGGGTDFGIGQKADSNASFSFNIGFSFGNKKDYNNKEAWKKYLGKQ